MPYIETRPTTVDMPDIETQRVLIDLYFTHVDPLLPIIDREEFCQAWEATLAVRYAPA